MKIDFFDRSRIPLLDKELDAFALRNRAIASNISNMDTPDYKRIDVDFQKELSSAIADSTNDVDLSKQVEDVDPQIEIDQSSVLPGGGNDVSIEQEMADLAKNQLQFKMASQLMSETFTLIDKSINGNGD